MVVYPANAYRPIGLYLCSFTKADLSASLRLSAAYDVSSLTSEMFFESTGTIHQCNSASQEHSSAQAKVALIRYGILYLDGLQ